VENAATTIHDNRGMLERMEESFRRRTVGRMACFAGQNSKSEYIALKICTVRFSGSLITNLILDLSNSKWRIQNGGPILKKNKLLLRKYIL
jgi:hypothetical protein